MKREFSNSDFYEELKAYLPTSSGEKRKVWVTAIIEKDLDIKDLSGLLDCEPKVASRFLWLLSEIGLSDPNKLFVVLPFLFDLCDRKYPDYKTSFANFWLIAGIPPENEAQAIDLSFQWALSADTNVTIKSRALRVLFKLTQKYPELKNELKLCLKDQLDMHTSSFKKRAVKLLEAISK